jgi:hypothetical protein
VILKSSLEGCKFVALRGGRTRSWRSKTSTRDASWKERLALLGKAKASVPLEDEFHPKRRSFKGSGHRNRMVGLLSRIILRPGLKIEAQSERNEVVLGKVEHFESRSA